MDDQKAHDRRIARALKRTGGNLLGTGSRERLEALLKKKAAAPAPAPALGPIERAMREHPGLTKEEALKMAEEFGF